MDGLVPHRAMFGAYLLIMFRACSLLWQCFGHTCSNVFPKNKNKNKKTNKERHRISSDCVKNKAMCYQRELHQDYTVHMYTKLGTDSSLTSNGDELVVCNFNDVVSGNRLCAGLVRVTHQGTDSTPGGHHITTTYWKQNKKDEEKEERL